MTARGVLACLALAGGASCWLGAWWLFPRAGLGEPAALTAWRDAHPDPRALSAGELARHLSQTGEARRDDALALLVALGAALLVAAAPILRPQGASPARVAARALAGGALVWAALSATRSGAEILRLGRLDRLAWGDDPLAAVAGPLAPTLASWRDTIPPGDTVLIAGTQDHLVNLVAWLLRPRALQLVALTVPDGMSAEEKRVAAAALAGPAPVSGRWLVDLRALETGADDALLRLSP